MALSLEAGFTFYGFEKQWGFVCVCVWLVQLLFFYLCPKSHLQQQQYMTFTGSSVSLCKCELTLWMLHLLSSVFECVYAQLVLPWYCVPEPREQQPLHQVLGREVDFIIDRIVEYGKDFDICQAVVGSIRILTQHLHNAKMPDRYDCYFLFVKQMQTQKVKTL